MQIARFLRARDISLYTHVVHNDMQGTAAWIEKVDEYLRFSTFRLKVINL